MKKQHIGYTLITKETETATETMIPDSLKRHFCRMPNENKSHNNNENSYSAKWRCVNALTCIVYIHTYVYVCMTKKKQTET